MKRFLTAILILSIVAGNISLFPSKARAQTPTLKSYIKEFNVDIANITTTSTGIKIPIKLQVTSTDAFSLFETDTRSGKPIISIQVGDYYFVTSKFSTNTTDEQIVTLNTKKDPNFDGYDINLSADKLYVIKTHILSKNGKETIYSNDGTTVTALTKQKTDKNFLTTNMPKLVLTDIKPSGNAVDLSVSYTIKMSPDEEYLPDSITETKNGVTKFKDGLELADYVAAATEIADAGTTNEDTLGTFYHVNGYGVSYKGDGGDGVFLYISENKDAKGGLKIPFQMNIFKNDTISLQTSGVLKPKTTYFARVILETSLFYTERTSPIVTFTTTDLTDPDKHRETDPGVKGESKDPSTTIQPNEGELPDCVWNSWTILGCFDQLFYSVVYKLSTFIVSLSGVLLDYMLAYSTNSDSYSGPFIKSGWGIVRDLANMMFIFVLLYVAIGTILNLHQVNYKDMIAKIIIVALLINFSLFFTKVVIDTGNILARFLNSGIEVKNSSTGEPLITSNGQKSISIALVDKMKIQKLTMGWKEGSITVRLKPDSEPVKLEGTTYAFVYLILMVVGSAIYLITAYTFFVIAWVFVGRVAGLWITMIFAPIAFVTYALPHGVKIPGDLGFDGWLKNLMNLTFLAPIFYFFLYIIIQFLQSGFLNDFVHAAGDDGIPDTMSLIMGVVLPFVIIIFLLNMAKKITLDMSGKFGGEVVKAAQKVTGVAAGVAVGGAALAGRQTFGRLAAQVTKDKDSKFAKFAASSSIGQYAFTKVQKVSKASFDARNTQAAKVAGKYTDINANSGAVKMLNLDTTKTKDGYKGWQERETKKATEFKESLGIGKSKEEKDINKEGKLNAAETVNNESATERNNQEQEKLTTDLNDTNTELANIAAILEKLEKEKSATFKAENEAKTPEEAKAAKDNKARIESEIADKTTQKATLQTKMAGIEEKKVRSENAGESLKTQAENIKDRKKDLVDRRNNTNMGRYENRLKDQGSLRSWRNNAWTTGGAAAVGIGAMALGAAPLVAAAAGGVFVVRTVLNAHSKNMNKNIIEAVRKEPTESEKFMKEVLAKVKKEQEHSGGDGQEKKNTDHPKPTEAPSSTPHAKPKH